MSKRGARMREILRDTDLRALKDYESQQLGRAAKERERAAKEDPHPCTFAQIEVGHRFTLRPHNFVGVIFVKTAASMAQIYSWDEHSQYQSFDKDSPALFYPYNEHRSLN